MTARAPRRWALLSGPKGSGLSARAAEVAARLAADGIRVGGFVQEPRFAQGQRVGFHLVRLDRPETVELARRVTQAPEGQLMVCSYAFDEGAFATARRWVREAAASEIVVVDEISKLEAAGLGHHAAIAAALDAGHLVLLSVRGEHLFDVVARLTLDEPVAALEGDGDDGAAGEEAVRRFADALAAAVRSSEAP